MSKAKGITAYKEVEYVSLYFTQLIIFIILIAL